MREEGPVVVGDVGVELSASLRTGMSGGEEEVAEGQTFSPEE